MGNTSPIFSRQGNISGATITAANTAKDGTGTTDLIFTADATNGSFVNKVKIRPVATNVATVVRFFLNNGSTPATAANNRYYDEAAVAATTNIETTATAGTEIALNIALPPGWRIYATLGTAVAGGMSLTAVGGDY